jgi:branched-chain amino acid transport system permease protein
VIGGASSLFGGILGGFVAGALQSFGVIWIDPRWQNLMIFSALIVILIVRPTGLLVAKR